MNMYCSFNLVLVFICASSYFVVNANIHRAIPGSPLSKILKIKNNQANENLIFDEDEEEGFLDRVYNKANIAWLYAIPATILVGSTGIFPLLIFRVKEGHSLKEAVSPEHLKLLLSFAVGGLLGDVFLHLLPEAWMYVDNAGHDHSGSLKIGLWIVVGLLCFLILEKIFIEEERFEEMKEKEENKQEENEKIPEEKSNSIHKNGYTNGELKNRSKNKEKEHTNGHIVTNGHGLPNGNHKVCENHKEKAIDENHTSLENIKVVGYLNLLANCIDNFTHGLAVAGSFIVSTPVGICTTFAILLHEIPHEIGDFAILLKAGFNRWDAAKGQMITASGALVGCLFGLIAEGAGDASAWVLPFTSGGFLYIALVTIVPDLLQETSLKESIKQIIALMAGIGVMAAVSLLHHGPDAH